MAEIFFPFQNLLAQELFGRDMRTFNLFSRNNALKCDKLTANMPYCLPGDYPEGRDITQTLGELPAKNREQLIRTIDAFGDFTAILADFYTTHLANLNLYNSSALMESRLALTPFAVSGFQSALLKYQSALLSLKKLQQARPLSAKQKATLKARVRERYDQLQQSYQLEINRCANRVSRSKQRSRISAHWRPGRGLTVSSDSQAEQIALLSRALRYVGEGMVSLDTGLVLRDKYNTFKHEDAASGSRTQEHSLGYPWSIYGNPRLSAEHTAIGLGYTPAGWVVLIGAGLAARFTTTYFAAH